MSKDNTTVWLRSESTIEKDEYYTPKLLTDVIVPFVPEGSTVWCPFDTENSEFVHSLKVKCTVVNSHIYNGFDFFEYFPGIPVDYIISNPPFTKKLKVLERLYLLGIPFAMVLPLTMLNYQEVGSFFLNKTLELLIVDKKVSFDGNTTSFNSSFFCNGMLFDKMIFKHLPHNNTGNNFVGSRMLYDIKK